METIRRSSSHFFVARRDGQHAVPAPANQLFADEVDQESGTSAIVDVVRELEALAETQSAVGRQHVDQVVGCVVASRFERTLKK
jgi:hypothetical protein